MDGCFEDDCLVVVLGGFSPDVADDHVLGVDVGVG